MKALREDPGIAFGGPATYRIRVQGRLTERAAEYIGDVQIEELDAQGATLKASVMDQAGLLGVLEAIYGLHLTIVSVDIHAHQQMRRA
jgi:hypothetical protein